MFYDHAGRLMYEDEDLMVIADYFGCEVDTAGDLIGEYEEALGCEDAERKAGV